MTLNDILVSALAQLDRGHDAQTLDIFRSRLTGFANDAQRDIALAIRFKRTDTVNPTAGVINVKELPRNCIRIERVRQLGHSVRFSSGDSGSIAVPYDAPAELTYRCEPLPLSSPTDVSELPFHTHGLIVTYVVGRERMAGDISTQRGANIYLSMYEAARAKLDGGLGDAESFRIVNRY